MAAIKAAKNTVSQKDLQAQAEVSNLVHLGPSPPGLLPGVQVKCGSMNAAGQMAPSEAVDREKFQQQVDRELRIDNFAAKALLDVHSCLRVNVRNRRGGYTVKFLL